MRRFLFEQRGRALAALSQAGAARPIAGLLDHCAEQARLSAVLESVLGGNGDAGDGVPTEVLADAFRQINSETLNALQQTLETGSAISESPDQLAGRVRALFNGLAESLPERGARIICHQLHSAGPQPDGAERRDPAAASAPLSNLKPST